MSPLGDRFWKILEAAMGLQTGLWPLAIFTALFLQVMGLIDN